jgi:TatD DNase family protein
MLVDSHCHLDFPDFEGELDAIMARAAARGVGAMVTIGTKLREFDRVRAIAERFDHVYCSVGVHPHEAEAEDGVSVDRLVAHAQHPKVVGIGETGLDFYYDHSPRDRQTGVFEMHIEAARQTGLPLIIHCRDADPQMAEMLRKSRGEGRLTGLIHCFSSTEQLSDAALEVGFSISLSGIVTFKNAVELRKIAEKIPIDRLLVETDSPYLAPVPNRGRRNEPAFVADTAAFLAELRGIPLEELAKQTTDNFFNLFKKAARPSSPPAA